VSAVSTDAVAQAAVSTASGGAASRAGSAAVTGRESVSLLIA
jgi:hypothetical protein